jgi:Ppx/GppA phosphatase family
MTDSDERGDGFPADGGMTADVDAEREARLVAKANAKAAKAVKKAARSEAKAVARAAEAADKAAKKAVKAAAKADARAVRAVRKVEREAAKAEARAQREIQRKANALAGAAARARTRGAEATRNSLQSPGVAAASAMLQEAAELMRQGERTTTEEAEPPAEVESPSPPWPEPEAAAEPDGAWAEAALEPDVTEGEFRGPVEALEAPEPAPEAERAAEAPALEELASEAEAEGPVDWETGSVDPRTEAEESADDLVPEVAEAEAEVESGAELDAEPQPQPDLAEPELELAEVDSEPELAEPAPAPAGLEPDVFQAEPSPESEDDLASPLPKPAATLLEPERMPVLAAGETPAALLGPPTGKPSIDASPGATVAAPPGATVAAAIDIGATSVHLLVGTVDGHRVVPLLDESVFLGLGDRVSAQGYIGDEGRAALAGDIERYAAASRELGATSITIVGTDPLRRAQDAASVVQAIGDQLGIPLHVLDHAEEGLLTLIGATGGRPVHGELLLVDIGGGSSEFVVVRPSGPVLSVGIPLGAARLTQDLVRADPPSLAEIEALRAEAARQVAEAPDASPVEIVAVGGTASNLMRLLPATAVDRSLTRRRIAVALAMLTVERSSEAAVRHLIRPERARILPAGAIVVDAILEKYRADRLRVSEEGIREGAILAAAHGNTAWRDRLAVMARGWVETAR